MRRIYFLVPTVAAARSIVDELLLARVEERHLHVVAREGTPLEDLPEARIAQSTDLVPALQRGVAAGGLAGLLAGVLAVAFPPAGFVFGGGALLGLTAFGAGFGAWMSSMVGVGLPNSRIEQYQQAIEAGQLLLMIDVQRDRVPEIEAMVTRHHPEAELEGVDPNIPLFP
ncbi:MAG: DUF1269 domain-containing protein [Ideonella sp.]|nr:DUF1269 domain-containing protein [Ideonella sp.]